MRIFRRPVMAHRKPIIGIVGGIGSGKSYVSKLFGQLGCLVIDSDQQVRDAYQREDVRKTLQQWWGEGVFKTDGTVNRSAVGARVFSSTPDRHRLERLLHPLVADERQKLMERHATDPQVLAFVWDTPLLFETGLDGQCDKVVFVDAARDVRLERVRTTRGWDEPELSRRENLQWPLDRKRQISDYVVTNATDADDVRGQVQIVLSRIIDETTSPRKGLSPHGEVE